RALNGPFHKSSSLGPPAADFPRRAAMLSVAEAPPQQDPSPLQNMVCLPAPNTHLSAARLGYQAAGAPLRR
ncbi:MAG: hypothetical protein Q7T63_00330, partial [Burkholderiaceae bacterium]|nr:hypothetical protein [Burkholderiaceae bacterium]